MKPSVVVTPLREIHLDYNSHRNLNKIENEAVNEYIKLHFSLAELYKEYDAVNGEIFRLELGLETFVESIAIPEAEIMKCGPLAGFTDEECEKNGIFEGEI